jgi:hypothetical protein
MPGLVKRPRAAAPGARVSAKPCAVASTVETWCDMTGHGYAAWHRAMRSPAIGRIRRPRRICGSVASPASSTDEPAGRVWQTTQAFIRRDAVSPAVVSVATHAPTELFQTMDCRCREYRYCVPIRTPSEMISGSTSAIPVSTI